jgi:hypothetical protein
MTELLEFSGLPIVGEISLIMLLPKLNNFEKIWAKDPKTSEEAFEIALELEGLHAAILENGSKRSLRTKNHTKFKIDTANEKACNSKIRTKKRKFKKMKDNLKYRALSVSKEDTMRMSASSTLAI